MGAIVKNILSFYNAPVHFQETMNVKFFSLAMAAAMAFSLGACANKKGAGNYTGVEGDTVNGTPLPDRQEGVSFMSGNVDKSQFKPVRFAFDSFAIDAGEEGPLGEVVSFLKSDSKNIIIAGFTDERGTPEYNRGLGERRALAVRQYLLSHGADGGKIQTVSFGAEMPADPASNEEAWAKNRRAEFGVVK
jgi:peptidoglycan-associated lipoprotein